MKENSTKYGPAVIGGMSAGAVVWGLVLLLGNSFEAAGAAGGLAWLAVMFHLLNRRQDGSVATASKTTKDEAERALEAFWNGPDESSSSDVATTAVVTNPGNDVRRLLSEAAGNKRRFERVTTALFQGLVDKVADEETVDPRTTLDEGLLKIDTLLTGAGTTAASFIKEKPAVLHCLRSAVIENHLNRGVLPEKGFKAARELLPGDERPLPFLLRKKEVLLFCAGSVGMTETKMESRYEAGSRGVTLRIAKGVSYRVGNVKGRRVSEEVEEYAGRGPVAVTNVNLYYECGGKSRRVALEKIVSVKRHRCDLTWVKDAARPKPVTWTFTSEGEAALAERVMKEAPELE